MSGSERQDTARFRKPLRILGRGHYQQNGHRRGQGADSRAGADGFGRQRHLLAAVCRVVSLSKPSTPRKHMRGEVPHSRPVDHIPAKAVNTAETHARTSSALPFVGAVEIAAKGQNELFLNPPSFRPPRISNQRIFCIERSFFSPA